MTQPPYDPNNPYQEQNPKAAAKAAKAYAKAQRPWFKKKRILLPLAFVLLIGISVAASGGGEDPSTGGSPSVAAPDTEAPDVDAPAEEAPAEAPEEEPAAPPPPAYAGATDNDTAVQAGQPIELSGWTVTATPLTRTSGSLDEPLLCTNVTLLNNDDEQQEYSSLSWKLQFPNGQVLDMTYTGENDLGNIGGAGMAPGGTVTQRACFDDPGAGPGQYVLAWQPDVFSSEDRGVWLNAL